MGYSGRMTEKTQKTPAEKLALIRAALEPFESLSAAEKDVAAAAILKHCDHLNKGDNRLLESTHFLDFKSKVDGVVAAFAEQGLTEEAYVRAALESPSLFYQSSATIIDNIRGVVKAFKKHGLTEEAYVKAALKPPVLFDRSSAKIIDNVRGMVKEFSALTEKVRVKTSLGIARTKTVPVLTEKAYVEAALKKPGLFVQSPEKMVDNIRGVVKEFEAQGLTEVKYVKAALRQPQLFTHVSTRIAKNIRDVVKEFKD